MIKLESTTTEVPLFHNGRKIIYRFPPDDHIVVCFRVLYGSAGYDYEHYSLAARYNAVVKRKETWTKVAMYPAVKLFFVVSKNQFVIPGGVPKSTNPSFFVNGGEIKFSVIGSPIAGVGTITEIPFPALTMVNPTLKSIKRVAEVAWPIELVAHKGIKIGSPMTAMAHINTFLPLYARYICRPLLEKGSKVVTTWEAVNTIEKKEGHHWINDHWCKVRAKNIDWLKTAEKNNIKLNPLSNIAFYCGLKYELEDKHWDGVEL